MFERLYHYQAKVIEVYDGDTFTADVDLGMHAGIHGEKLRLNRIDAPEVTGETKAAGLASRDALRSLILGKTIYIQTLKDKKEKYGRYLAEVFFERTPGDWVNASDILVQIGHAIYRSY